MITLAIHTYERAVALRAMLEGQGVAVEFASVGPDAQSFSSGVRVRIREEDLPLALKLVEDNDFCGFTPRYGSMGKNPILVPVDFSEHSFRAVLVAAKIAGTHKTGIRLLYSYVDPYLNGGLDIARNIAHNPADPLARKYMRDNAGRMMNNFEDRIRRAMHSDTIPSVPLSAKIVEGVAEDSIIEYATGHETPLLVMGTRSAARKSSELIGSVTGEVLDEGRFTVLTVPDTPGSESLASPQGALFLTTLDRNDILAIDTLYRLYPELEMRVLLAYTPHGRTRFGRSPSRAGMDELIKYCRDTFVRFKFELVSTELTDSLEHIENLENQMILAGVGLIVLPNRRRNAFSRLLNPGVANNLLFKTDIPLLVCPG